jgi:hypothetical protein
VKDGQADRIRKVATALVSASYVDLFGQKYLRQSCAALQNEACARQGEFVELGLLKSVVESGDGKTCPTGWEVASIDEEYFVLAMVGANLRLQSLVNGPPACDAMDTVDADGKQATYFFRIDAVLADEESMFMMASPK